MSGDRCTAAEAFDALQAFDSTLVHPWPICQPADSLDTSLVDLPYSHLLLPSPPHSLPSPLALSMSHSATRHARHSSLRTPLPAKRALALPTSAASASSASSTNTAPAAFFSSPASRASRRSIGRASPPTVKLAARTPLHHRRVSSFSPTALSPQAADDKQAGRTPRRRPAETNHRITSPATAVQPVTVTQPGSELSAAAAAGGKEAGGSSTPPTLRRSAGGEGRDELPADAITDDDILGKLHQLLEEALVIQQAQGQVQAQIQTGQHAPQRAQPAPHRPLADITNATPGMRAVQRPTKAQSEKKSNAAEAGKENYQPSARTQPKKSVMEKATATSTPASSTGSRTRPFTTTRRAILATQPINAADRSNTPSPAKPAQTAVSVNTPTTAAELSAVIRRFLQRVLSLLRVIERLLSRRMAQLRVEAVKLLRDSWCGTSGISSCLERLASTSTSLLHSMHAAIHAPIITLHYPEALAALIPSFLSASPPSTIPSSLSSPAASVNNSPAPLCPSQTTQLATATSPPPSSALPEAAIPSTSDPSAATSPIPRAEQQPPRACCSSLATERTVLVSTIHQLQSFLAAQQSVSSQQQLSSLSAENRDMRSLIEAQEQQIARQQDMIVQARRQIEWQCQADVSGDNNSGCGGGSGAVLDASLELSALTDAIDGSSDGGSGSGRGSGSGCGDVSALMRAEWESGVQEVMTW